MKYKTKIVSRGNKYVGELLENGHVIYTTEELSDPVIVSRAIAAYISQTTPPPVSLPSTSETRALNQAPIANSSTRSFLSAERAPARRAYPPTARKCCGRE